LASAFVLIPTFGSQHTLLGLAVLLCLGSAMVALAGSASPRVRTGLLAAASAGTLCALAQPDWDWKGITNGANVHFNASYTTARTDLLFVHEDVHGGVTTIVKNAGKPRVLLTNGKFQGDDRGQMPAQVGFALVPLIHLPSANEALVIGLGTGHSANVVADAGFAQVDIAEIAPGIIKAARSVLFDLNGGVLDKTNVSLHLDDGRNFVLRSKKQYDLVTIEISSVWFAGATNLYAREFYVAVHEKIATHGILQQWVQLHHITTIELLATILTLRDVFEHVE
jgi:spermidine synthase